MSRLSKILMVLGLILFVLACNFATQPLEDAQNIAGTAQSLASAIPVETLQALATAIPSVIPAETLQALPSAVPTLEALASALPDFGDMFNPQGTPVADWNGIPIMPEAVAGQEVQGIYSYKANVTSEAAAEFYTSRLPQLDWNEQFNQPGETTVIFYLKDSQSLTITIAPLEDGSRLIWLALQ